MFRTTIHSHIFRTKFNIPPTFSWTKSHWWKRGRKWFIEFDVCCLMFIYLLSKLFYAWNMQLKDFFDLYIHYNYKTYINIYIIVPLSTLVATTPTHLLKLEHHILHFQMKTGPGELTLLLVTKHTHTHTLWYIC